MQAAAPSVTMRNRILVYVYNLFGERETIIAGKKPETAPQRSPEGIVLKATPPGASPSAPSAAKPATRDADS
jgi:hypothetical protein